LTAGLLCYPAFSEGVLCHHRVTLFGSNANNGGQAGAFYWNVNIDSSNGVRNIGGRLTVASKNRGTGPSPLGGI